MSRSTAIWLLFVLPGILSACKDPYVSPYKSPATGYLVVEGYISGNTTTQFTLTRSVALPGDTTLPTEDGATVQVQGSDNSIYPLTGLGNGIYSSADTLQLNQQLEYRLSIKTGNGKQYLSDFVPLKPTPPIDSVSWVLNGDNTVQLYVNTHDPAANTHYYQWNYGVTYEHHSAEESSVYYDKDTVPPAVIERPSAMQIFRCWSSFNSTNIIIDNTTKLSSDLVYLQPIYTIPAGSIQQSVLFSILVRQYSLSADGYAFLSLMQKNTESLGSIFDAQPSQITGNIHCVTTPSELVIGYVSAGTVQTQRIFITSEQAHSTYRFGCPVKDSLMPPDSLDLAKNYGNRIYTPLYSGPMPGSGWITNYTVCVDCTQQGGSTTEPAFWPN